MSSEAPTIFAFLLLAFLIVGIVFTINGYNNVTYKGQLFSTSVYTERNLLSSPSYYVEEHFYYNIGNDIIRNDTINSYSTCTIIRPREYVSELEANSAAANKKLGTQRIVYVTVLDKKVCFDKKTVVVYQIVGLTFLSFLFFIFVCTICIGCLTVNKN